jgi:hypothetical protein
MKALKNQPFSNSNALLFSVAEQVVKTIATHQGVPDDPSLCKRATL